MKDVRTDSMGNSVTTPVQVTVIMVYVTRSVVHVSMDAMIPVTPGTHVAVR